MRSCVRCGQFRKIAAVDHRVDGVPCRSQRVCSLIDGKEGPSSGASNRHGVLPHLCDTREVRVVVAAVDLTRMRVILGVMRNWLLQCNPKVWDVFAWWEDQAGDLDTWTISSHLKE